MKQLKIMLLTLLAVLCFSGCSAFPMTLNPQELYALPKLPERYTALNEQISSILENGAEYVVPAAGSNIQSVQMTDLDGDGREEALAFFRKADEEKPLKICVFTAEGSGYRLSTLIEGSGAALNSITYSDLNGNGQMELIVGWRVSAELQALSVYDLDDWEARELIRTDYVKYAVADLDENGQRELTVLRTDQEGIGVADCYGWRTGTMALESFTRVSMTMAELSRQGRLTIGKLTDGSTGLFITGVADGARAITDVLTMDQDGLLNNILLSDATGVTKSVAVFRGLYPADINNDGVMEIPTPKQMPSKDDEDAALYRIDWSACQPDGEENMVFSTFHDMEQGWYLQLPDDWKDQILAERGVSSEESSVTFYRLDRNDGTYEPLLKITALSGTNRERLALRTGRFILRRQRETIYVAELMRGNENWKYGVTEDRVRGAFSLISREWAASDA